MKQLCQWLGTSNILGQFICSFIILAAGEFIAILSVVGIEYHGLIYDNLKEECSKFMYSAEANIGNTNKTLYNGIQLENTYHLGFYYDPDGDYVVLQ